MAQHIGRCKWADQTLFSNWPYWLDAWTWPWTCSREGRRQLPSGCETCRDCPHWDSGADDPQIGKTKVRSEIR